MRSDERAAHDTVAPTARTFAGQYSPQLLQTIDWCLKLDPLERPQSVYSLQKVLMRRDAEPPTVAAPRFGDLGARIKSFIGRS